MPSSAPVHPKRATKKPTSKPKAKPKAKGKRGRPVGSSNKMFGLPVRDAKNGLAMPLLQIDIDKAQKTKPEDVNAQENFLSCVIAQAATRACGADRVAIYRRTAYIAFPGEKHTKRYEIDPKSQSVLAAWDRGEPVLEGVELRLKAPSKSRTLASMRKQRKRWGRKHPEVHGKAGSRKTKRKQTPADPLHNVVRNGNLVRWG